jgi:sugar phosphate isomerase/epimerase
MQTRRQFLGTTLAAAGVLTTRGFGADSPRWQIGCYTRPWDQHEWRVAFDAIAGAGFKHIGLMTTKSKTRLILNSESKSEEAAAVGAEAKQRGLQIISMWGGQFTDVASLKRLIENSAACGCPNLLLGGTDEKRAAAYYKTIAECCDFAAGKKVGLSVKPHGGNNANSAQCRKLIEQVGHKNFRLWYDPGNIFFYSEGKLDPVEDAAAADGLVVGMSVKDFKPPKEVALTPGTGKVDFPKVMTRLKRGGFAGGPLVVECLDRGELPQLATAAKQAREFVERLVAGLEPSR